MEHLLGGIVEIIGVGVSKSFGAAYRALDTYDGRRLRWPSAAAAALAAALYAPMVVGSFFAVGAAWELMNSDFMWFLGLILIIPTLLMVALAVSAVGLGFTVGAWLLIDRPGARWYAGLLAVGAVMSGVFVLSMQTWASQVIGWSTIGLAAALLVALLLPEGELPATPAEEPAAAQDRVPERPALTQPVTRRGRFVL